MGNGVGVFIVAPTGRVPTDDEAAGGILTVRRKRHYEQKDYGVVNTAMRCTRRPLRTAALPVQCTS